MTASKYLPVQVRVVKEPLMHRVFRHEREDPYAPPPVVVSWTPNPKMSDAEVRSYFVGLVIVTMPGALHGVEDPNEEQVARAERVRAYLDSPMDGDFNAEVIKCL